MRLNPPSGITETCTQVNITDIRAGINTWLRKSLQSEYSVRKIEKPNTLKCEFGINRYNMLSERNPL